MQQNREEDRRDYPALVSFSATTAWIPFSQMVVPSTTNLAKGVIAMAPVVVTTAGLLVREHVRNPGQTWAALERMGIPINRNRRVELREPSATKLISSR